MKNTRKKSRKKTKASKPKELDVPSYTLKEDPDTPYDLKQQKMISFQGTKYRVFRDELEEMEIYHQWKKVFESISLDILDEPINVKAPVLQLECEGKEFLQYLFNTTPPDSPKLRVLMKLINEITYKQKDQSEDDDDKGDYVCYRCEKKVDLDELRSVDKKIEGLEEDDATKVADEFVHCTGPSNNFHDDGITNVCQSCLDEILKDEENSEEE